MQNIRYAQSKVCGILNVRTKQGMWNTECARNKVFSTLSVHKSRHEVFYVGAKQSMCTDVMNKGGTMMRGKSVKYVKSQLFSALRWHGAN